MATFERYEHGHFCWVDLSSHDQNKAETFYKNVFGWEATREATPMGEYIMFTSGGKQVAGCGQLSEEMIKGGMPSLWNSYINVDDVDAVASKVKELGGQLAMDPFDVMEHGRMTFITDPTGAAVGLWQAKGHFGAAIANIPVSLAWNELLTRDVDGAKKFYSELLGWSYNETPNPAAGGTYNTIMNKERANGGIMAMAGPQFENIPPHWGAYFAVESVEDTVEKVKQNEGKLLMPPMDIPEVGRMAALMDCTGAAFTAIKLINPE